MAWSLTKNPLDKIKNRNRRIRPPRVYISNYIYCGMVFVGVCPTPTIPWEVTTLKKIDVEVTTLKKIDVGDFNLGE